MFLASWRGGHSGIGTCWSSWFHVAFGHGSGYPTSGLGRRPLPALQRRPRHHVPQLLRVPCLADTARRARLAGGAPQYREQFAHGIFPSPAAILLAGALFCGTIGSQTGSWRGHIFTEGSSSGSGALRRANWAVVAVDDVGDLKAAACGAVPSDVLLAQTSRDGEDCAAAVAGIITMDPLTLYIDCERTIATVNGPKCEALGPGAHVWSRLLVSHDEVRAVKVKGPRDTGRRGGWAHFPSVEKGNDYADTFAKKRAETHKPAFRVAKTVVARASLAKQAARWAAEAQPQDWHRT